MEKESYFKVEKAAFDKVMDFMRNTYEALRVIQEEVTKISVQSDKKAEKILLKLETLKDCTSLITNDIRAIETTILHNKDLSDRDSSNSINELRLKIEKSLNIIISEMRKQLTRMLAISEERMMKSQRKLLHKVFRYRSKKEQDILQATTNSLQLIISGKIDEFIESQRRLLAREDSIRKYRGGIIATSIAAVASIVTALIAVVF